jgi:hypothetical protein
MAASRFSTYSQESKVTLSIPTWKNLCPSLRLGKLLVKLTINEY